MKAKQRQNVLELIPLPNAVRQRLAHVEEEAHRLRLLLSASEAAHGPISQPAPEEKAVPA